MTERTWTRGICGFLAANVVGAVCAAIVPVSQTRSVYGWIDNGSGGYSPMTITAPDFGPFNASAGYTIGQPYFVSGSGRQMSSVHDGATIAAWGSANAVVHRGYFKTCGASDFSFTFDLTAGGTYLLSGYTLFDDTYGDPDALNQPPTVTLAGPSGIVFSAPAATPDGTQADFGAPDVTLVLAAGRYTIEAHAAAACGISGAVTTTEYSLHFARACVPCDANCDGSVNPFDIQPFIAALGGANRCAACAADANGDGTVSPFDIQAFLSCLGG